MLKRTTLNYVNDILKKNNNWKVLDIGCGYTANENANVLADMQDLSFFYKNKKFIQIKSNKLPFLDNEFDFVISSHVIEHVENFEFFINELQRISKKGYIELPTRLEDNLIFENKTDHIWWFVFDDINKKLIASKRNQLIDPFLSVATGQKLKKIFRESLVLELLWQNNIEYEVNEKISLIDIKKMSFIEIIRKYLSKKLRMFLKK